MRRALEADGEKLRQLTGEDHGPWDWPEWEPIERCPHCSYYIMGADATMHALGCPEAKRREI